MRSKASRAVLLLSFREILICGSRFQHLTKEPQQLRDVVKFPFVCLGRETGSYAFYQKLFLKHDLSFHVDMEASTIDRVPPLVQYNLGIGFFSETLATPTIAQGVINQIRLAETVPERSISLIEDTSSRRALP